MRVFLPPPSSLFSSGRKGGREGGVSPIQSTPYFSLFLSSLFIHWPVKGGAGGGVGRQGGREGGRVPPNDAGSWKLVIMEHLLLLLMLLSCCTIRPRGHIFNLNFQLMIISLHLIGIGPAGWRPRCIPSDFCPEIGKIWQRCSLELNGWRLLWLAFRPLAGAETQFLFKLT